MGQKPTSSDLVQIPAREFEARLERLREGMAEQGLDALLAYSWKRGQVRYLTGYHPDFVANVAVAVIPMAGTPTLLIRFPFDLGRARRMSWFDDVRASGDWEGLVRDCTALLAQHGASKGRLGLVGGDSVGDELPHFLHERLVHSLPRATFVPALQLPEKARLVKSRTEQELIANSARVTDAALHVAREALAPGRTEYEVVAEAEHSARALRAEDYIAAISCRTAERAGPPRKEVVASEELIVLEFAARVEGYWSQAARTFVAGVPCSIQRHMYEVAYRSYLAGVKAVRPGNEVGDVARAQLAVLEEAGWLDWREYDLGHGDGLDHPEAPSITTLSTVPIEPGMTLCVHSGLLRPGAGNVFVGGTVVAGEGSATCLHDIPVAL
jgi:Xaa-Pro aminopeptidase